MKVVYKSYSQSEILTLQSILQFNDIETFLLDSHHVHVQPHLALAVGMRIAVGDEDVDSATEIIREYLGKKKTTIKKKKIGRPIDNSQCPECQSNELTIEEVPRTFTSLIVGFLFMIPFVWRRKIVSCQECGVYWFVPKSEIDKRNS
jgi:hypothetical protein